MNLSVSLAQCTVYVHLPHAKQESFLLHRGRYKRGCAIEMKLGYETDHGGWGLERGDPSSVKVQKHSYVVWQYFTSLSLLGQVK